MPLAVVTFPLPDLPTSEVVIRASGPALSSGRVVYLNASVSVSPGVFVLIQKTTSSRRIGRVELHVPGEYLIEAVQLYGGLDWAAGSFFSTCMSAMGSIKSTVFAGRVLAGRDQWLFHLPRALRMPVPSPMWLPAGRRVPDWCSEFALDAKCAGGDMLKNEPALIDCCGRNIYGTLLIVSVGL